MTPHGNARMLIRLFWSLNLRTNAYIYIYIYIEREREREGGEVGWLVGFLAYQPL